MASWDAQDVRAFNKLSDWEKGTYVRAIESEGVITEELKKIVLDNGGYLDGLDYRIKSPSSLFEKIYLRPDTIAIEDIKDLVRYTEIQDADNLVNATHRTLSELENNGYEVLKLKNTWVDDTNPYNGVNVQLKSPDGQMFELQVHTPESFALKNSQEMHGLYEQARLLGHKSKEYVEIQDKMFELSDKLTKPNNIEHISNCWR